MMRLFDRSNFAKTVSMVVAAAAMTFASTPAALAGGGHYGAYGHGKYYAHGPRYRARHYYAGRRPYARGRHYYGGRRHYRRGRISGGEAAIIAAGIIGGVILIDQAIQADRRHYYERRRYQRRNYDDRYARGPFDDDYYYRRGGDDLDREEGFDRPYDWEDNDALNGQERSRRAPAERDSLDDELLGGVSTRPGYTIRAAYRECAAETRGAAGAGGMMVALPGEPANVEKLDNGAVRLTTVFTAQNPRGQQWRRTMVCEADGAGVTFLEIA